MSKFKTFKLEDIIRDILPKVKKDTTQYAYLINPDYCGREVLIDSCIDYYYDRLNLSLYSDSREDVNVLIGGVLQLIADYQVNNIQYSGLIELQKEVLKLDIENDDIHDGMYQIILHILENAGFITHGSSVYSSYMMEDGVKLLHLLKLKAEINKVG